MEEKDLGLSLWLIPPSSYQPASALLRLTSQTFPSSPNFPNSPGFQPHITLTSRIPLSSQFLFPALDLESINPPEIEFGEIAHGSEYFKFIFLRIKKTPTLLNLAKRAREVLLPNAGPFDDAIYDPHVSLVYSNEQVTEEKIEYVGWETVRSIGETKGWTGGKVVLVDTRSRDAKKWKFLEEWSFTEQ